MTRRMMTTGEDENVPEKGKDSAKGDEKGLGGKGLDGKGPDGEGKGPDE